MYNKKIQTTSDKQATLAQFTQNTNQATADLIKQSNGMVVSEKAKQKAINASTNAAKASKVAMSALATAGNMLLAMAISKGVEWLFTYNQRLEESRQEMIEAGKEAAQLTQNLDGLMEQYRKLGEDGKFDNSDREQAYEIQQQINELLGEEVSAINLANGEYEEQLELLKKLQYEKANEKYAEIVDSKDAAEENLKRKGGEVGVGFNEKIDGKWESDAVKDLIEEEMPDFSITANGGINVGNYYNDSAEDFIKNYNNMIELRTKLRKSYTEEIAEGGQLYDFYNNLNKKIKDMSDAVQKYKDAINDYNVNQAVIQFNETEFDVEGLGKIKGAFIDSKEAMSGWITSMMNSKDVSDGVQTELIALARTWYPQYVEQINNAVNAKATENIQNSLKDKSISDNIETLKTEATILGLTETAMIELVLAEIRFNKNKLNNSQKVSALKEIAIWAGVAQEKVNAALSVTNKSTGKEKEDYANTNGFEVLGKDKTKEKWTYDGVEYYSWAYRDKSTGIIYDDAAGMSSAVLDKTIQSHINSINNLNTNDSIRDTVVDDNTTKEVQEIKETFNWIETALSRAQRAVTNFGKTVSATWHSWSTRNSELKKQISAVNNELSLQQQARDTYLTKANSVGLPEPYKTLVQTGGIRIDELANKGLGV